MEKIKINYGLRVIMSFQNTIQTYIDFISELLEKFIDDSSGFYLSALNQANLKQNILEVYEILNAELGKNNLYSNNLMNTYNTQVGGFPLSPTYKGVLEIRGILTAAKKVKTSPNNSVLLNKIEATKDLWIQINSDYGFSKRKFGRKINFIKTPYKKTVIYRDIAHAYSLSQLGYFKSSVILAGSVIEEIIRLYLKEKSIKPKDNRFISYIEACELNGLLKNGISKLSDSVRYFRNLVHMKNESSKKDSITKSKAKNAVSSIFIIADDF